MRVTLPLAALIGVASAAAAGPVTTACNANNCLRAVRGSAFPTRSGAADCSAYQTTTSTATITITTAGVVATSPAPTSTSSRSATKPGYASACADDAAYRSACSCNGQTSTVVTTTSTVTVSATAPCHTYALQATGAPHFDGYYLVTTSLSAYLSLGPSELTQATPLDYDATTGFFYPVGRAPDPDNNNAVPVFSVSPANSNYLYLNAYYADDISYLRLKCTIAEVGGLVACQYADSYGTSVTSGQAVIFQEYLYMDSSGGPYDNIPRGDNAPISTSFVPINFKAVPVCT